MSKIATPTVSPSNQEIREQNLDTLTSDVIDHNAIERYLSLSPNSIASFAATIQTAQHQSPVATAIELLTDATVAVAEHRNQLVGKMNDQTLHSLASRLGITNLPELLARNSGFDNFDARQRPVLLRLKELKDLLCHTDQFVEVILRAEADSGMAAPRKSFSIITASRFALANRNVSQQLLEFALTEFACDQSLELPTWFLDTNVIQRLRDQPDRSLFQEDVWVDFRITAGLILCFKPYWDQNRAALTQQHQKALEVQAKKSKQKRLAGRKGTNSRAMRSWTSRTKALIQFSQENAFEKVERDADKLNGWLKEFADGLIENGKPLSRRTKAKIVGFFSTVLLQTFLPTDDLVAALHQEGHKVMSPEIIDTCQGILAGSSLIEV